MRKKKYSESRRLPGGKLRPSKKRLAKPDTVGTITSVIGQYLEHNDIEKICKKNKLKEVDVISILRQARQMNWNDNLPIKQVDLTGAEQYVYTQTWFPRATNWSADSSKLNKQFYSSKGGITCI